MKKKYWITDNELSNKDKFRPVFNFRANCNGEQIEFLKNLKERRELSSWVTSAIDMLYDYEQNKNGFLIRIIQQNFEKCKHFLRMIGRANNDN